TRTKRNHEMADMFDPPSTSSGVKLADLSGRLLLIKPLAYEENMQTAFGVANAVRANIVELDGPDAGTEHTDVLIFPKVVANQVKDNIGTGRYNLGRLGRGQAKPGQSAPWILAEPTEEDKDTARRYL